MSTPAPNPLRNVILMVAFAIVAFLAFLAYSVHSSIENNERLSTIKAAYFPVLERVDANIVRLDKMEEKFMQAVMIGEQDPLAQASEFQQQADTAFGEMLALFPAYTNEINSLRAEFNNYHKLATETSLSLLNNEPGDMQVKTARMNAALGALRHSVQQFRQFSYDKFVLTLDESKQAARLSLYMGIAVGVMNLFFMGVLVFFIRNNVKMMAVIAEQNASLERRVAERTAQLTQKTNDINAMLQNMKLGVCTIIQDNRLHPEYSAYMQVLFGRNDIAGNALEKILFFGSPLSADIQDQVKVALSSIIGEDAMMFDFNGHLLIHEMELVTENGLRKIVHMDWSPITSAEGVVDKVLLIIEDVTELRQLELEAHHQKEELDLIAQIIKVAIGKFNEFITSSLRYVSDSRTLIEAAPGYSADSVAALFRNMHTIKGNARTYQFNFITEVAHEVEQHYDQMRKDPESPWDRNALLQELDTVQTAIQRYVLINEDKLGRKGRAGDLLTTRGSFVSTAELDELRELTHDIAQVSNIAPVMLLQNKIARLGHVPLSRLIDGALDSLSALAKELGKPTPNLQVEGGDIAFVTAFAEALKSSLIHIMRNSMDHGIETPAVRIAAGKPEQGTLSFHIQRNAQHLEIQIRDDGRGLALHKLYQKALNVGLFAVNQKVAAQDIAELIFNSGLSTAEQITQVSGRGVGMDAVRSFLEEQGGRIEVVLDAATQPPSFTSFHFRITVPEASYIQ